MKEYIESISSNLPSGIILLKAGDDRKCPVYSNNKPMKAWTSRTESDSYDPNWSNYAMLTGSASGIWVFDIDNHDATNLNKTFEWFRKYNFDPTADAFTVETPSGGYHIYFKYTDDLIDVNRKYLDNDIQINGKCVIFIGSSYLKGYIIKENKKEEYKYENAYTLINDVEIKEAPKFILDVIKRRSKNIESSIGDNYDSDYGGEESGENQVKERIRKILTIIKKKRADEYNDWIKIGMIIKNELGNLGFDLFDEFSKLSKKYDGYNNLKTKWDSFKIDSSLKIGTLIMMAQDDNPKFFEKEMKDKEKEMKDKEKEMKDKEKEKEELKYINMEIDTSMFINKFEDDDFTMVKFLRYLDITKFEDKKDAYHYIRDNLHRVCALIGIRTLIIKNNLICNSDQITFDDIEAFGKNQLIKFEGMNPSKPITLYKILFTNREFICRYEKISTSISYNSNNIEEFYVTRPYVAKKVDYKIEELEFILEFIKHTLSNEDEEVYKSIINWLAWIVQFPDIKSGIVPVFISLAGGTGKTKFIEFLYKFVIGEHLYAPVQDVGGVTETQNKHLMGRKLVYVNEMATTREQFLSQFQKLKGLITEDIFKMKALFKDHIFLKNSLEFILTANTVDCIPQEKKQRRFFPIRFNSDRMNNFEYFAKFEDITWNYEYGNKFYSYLMDIPNLTMGVVRRFPKTKLGAEMLENQMNSFDSFMDDLFNYQLINIINTSIKETDNKYTINCVYLYDQYMEYHKRLFSTTKAITYRKFTSHIKSEDNEYKISFNERKNGKEKTTFTFVIE